MFVTLADMGAGYKKMPASPYLGNMGAGYRPMPSSPYLGNMGAGYRPMPASPYLGNFVDLSGMGAGYRRGRRSGNLSDLGAAGDTGTGTLFTGSGGAMMFRPDDYPNSSYGVDNVNDVPTWADNTRVTVTYGKPGDDVHVNSIDSGPTVSSGGQPLSYGGTPQVNVGGAINSLAQLFGSLQPKAPPQVTIVQEPPMSSGVKLAIGLAVATALYFLVLKPVMKA